MINIAKAVSTMCAQCVQCVLIGLPLSGSETVVDIVLLQPQVLFTWKGDLDGLTTTLLFTYKTVKFCVKAKSTALSLSQKDR